VRNHRRGNMAGVRRVLAGSRIGIEVHLGGLDGLVPQPDGGHRPIDIPAPIGI
jgi:hypothetical protein